MIGWESPGDEAVLTQHFQCKSAEDYIMAMADLGQSWGFSALQTPRAWQELGLATEHTGWQGGPDLSWL